MSRILIVDDDEDYASVVRLRLQKEGYEVEWDGDPDAALKRLDKDFNFDVMLLDVQMPKKNGLAAITYFKRHFAKRPGGFNIPIVVTTALLSEKLRDIFQGQHIAGYLQKPFESNVLKKKIEEVLEKKGPH